MSEIKFKSIKKKRSIRRRNSSSDEETPENKVSEGCDINEKLLETVEIQKLRKRAHGVNSATLASGKKVSKVDELVHNDPDPFKLKTGGLLTLDKGKPCTLTVFKFLFISPTPLDQKSPPDRCRDLSSATAP